MKSNMVDLKNILLLKLAVYASCGIFHSKGSLKKAVSAHSGYASPSSNPSGYGQIDHAQYWDNDFSNLYLNKKDSDVVLEVDDKRFYTHRHVLTARSEYFSALLSRGYSESHQPVVKISEASSTSFNVLLKYVYTGRINLNDLEDKVILELFNISDFFGFPNLQPTLSEYWQSEMNVYNVCSMFEAARLYKLKELQVESLEFIDTNAPDVLKSDDFLFSSAEALLEILHRDSLCAQELDIFRAVCRWIKGNPNRGDPQANTNVLSAVRYSLMSDDVLLSEIRDSKLVTWDTISKAVQLHTTLPPHKLPVRGQLKPDVNFVGISEANPVSNESDDSTMIKFNRPSIVNYIEILLCGDDVKFYRYYIEVSMDQRNWVRVIDHSMYDCWSIQRLWIRPRVVRYIRVVGTKNTDNKTFNFLKVMYNTQEMHKVVIEKGLVVPKYNFLTLSLYGVLIEKDYNGDDRAKWQRTGTGCILVQLEQPYMLSSMRMQLWNYVDRYLSYIIEVSVDNEDWKMVVDKSNVSARSWQLLRFAPRPVVYIRITDFGDSGTKIFSCVCLEIPAPEGLDSNIV